MRQFIAPLALAQQRAGFDVRCACTPGPHWDELISRGLNMVPVEVARSASPLKAAGAILRIRRSLLRERPDVLHVHTPIASMIGRLAGWLAGVPVIVYTAHGFYLHDRMKPLQRRLHVLLERAFGCFNHYLFCVSAEDCRTAIRERIARRGRVHFVGNGADPRRFDPVAHGSEARGRIRAEFSIPEDATVISIMGRLVREKGHLEFFEAARRIAASRAGVHFLVIGDTVTSEHDDAKAAIMRRARQIDSSRVHFTGLRDDVPELLAATDIFCLPSHREGMPVSVIEAMMMGLPVVATRIRGCRELVSDGEHGFLVEPGDAGQLEGALRFLVDHSDVARAMGASGRSRALRRCDERRILQRQLAILNSIHRAEGLMDELRGSLT